jgi:hypothetical protein
MNDPELVDLCKEVFERLPMWDSTEKCYAYIDDYSPGAYYWQVIPLHEDNVDGVDEWHPLYTSDYLLEKLPSDCGVQKLYTQQFDKHFYNAFQVQFKNSQHESRLETGADAPLKALLKLVIALHEAGDVS